MGNEQQRGTSHHFFAADQTTTRGTNGPLWTRNGRMPNSKQIQTIPSITSKPPNWQLTRDASMEILERKTTKLAFKQGKIVDNATPALVTSRSVLKKYPPAQETNFNEKPKPVHQTPRMPTDKDVSRVNKKKRLSFFSILHSFVRSDRCRLSTFMFVLRGSMYRWLSSLSCLCQSVSLSMSLWTWLSSKSIIFITSNE